MNKQKIDKTTEDSDHYSNNNNKNSNNHNKKHSNPNQFHGFPNHEIAFDHISNGSARKYARHLEKNIRSEQLHHIEKFTQYFDKLQQCTQHNIQTFEQHFTFKVHSYDIDPSNHECFVTLKSIKTKRI